MLSMPGDIEKMELPVALAIGDMDAYIHSYGPDQDDRGNS
jgi:hypothetical protein